jgi:nitroreductase
VPYWYIDTGFAALLILLAVDEELGAVFFGIHPAIMADFRMRFGVPAEWTPIGAIAIGYPDPGADPVPPARASNRKSLGELVHLGRW